MARRSVSARVMPPRVAAAAAALGLAARATAAGASLAGAGDDPLPDAGCACLAANASAAVLGGLRDRACVADAATGEAGVHLRVREHGCVPLTYGAGCASHDATHDPGRCDMNDPACAAELARPWCYVADRAACMAASDQRVYRSEHFTDDLVRGDGDRCQLSRRVRVCQVQS